MATSPTNSTISYYYNPKINKPSNGLSTREQKRAAARRQLQEHHRQLLQAQQKQQIQDEVQDVDFSE